MGITKFTLYIDTLCVLDEMDDRQAGKLFKAIKAYWLRKAERCQQDAGTGFDSLMEDFVTRIAFAPFKAQFERESRIYDDAVGKNMANGKKGGRPKKTQITQCGFSEKITQWVFRKPKKTQITQWVFRKPKKTQITQWVFPLILRRRLRQKKINYLLSSIIYKKSRRRRRERAGKPCP